MSEAAQLALKMLQDNVAEMDGLQGNEKMSTRFKIATTAARLAECDKRSVVSHEWRGPRPPIETTL